MLVYRISLSFFLVNWIFSSLQAAEIDFDRDVRPILSDKCYACHGPDQSERQADLRLDVREGLFGERDGTTVVVPGETHASALIERITALDDSAMPPADHPKQLSAVERATLIRWVESGAVWEEHWAYVLPERQPVPVVSHGAVVNFIDSFVLARLSEAGLGYSDEADRRTLLRRLSFDLIGLPPTAAEVDAFLADRSTSAYQKVVDRLMRSPHFGERMAMYWLDLVRYADSVGYHGDQDVSVSPYRDYVINAFNDNMPFDRFTKEQLAGDLLPDPTREQLIASGYNKLGMMSAEGGVQPEEYLVKYAADRVRNASTVWLGSTLGCAECHDHKFDPFTAKDFYRFASFFADIKERGLYSGGNDDDRWGPTVKVPDLVLPELLQPIDDRIAELKAALATSTPELERAQAEWEQEQRIAIQSWKPVGVESATALHGTDLIKQPDGSWLAGGSSPDQNQYVLLARTELENVTAFRLDVLPDSSLPNNGPGRAGNGNFVVTELRVFRVDETGAEKPVELSQAVATIEQEAGKENPYGKWSAESAIDGDSKGASWGWAILPQTGKSNSLAVLVDEPVSSELYRFVIEQNHTNPKHTLGHFRISATNSMALAKGELLGSVPIALQALLLVPATQRTPIQCDEVAAYYRSIAPELESIRTELATLKKQREQVVATHTRSSLITVAVEPREMRVLHRGNWMDKSGEVVKPGVPHFLSQLETQSRATRLDLANWLVARENPLTARVFVNRLWKMYFGVGLSKVLDDVGSQGESPVHPELLDHLAVEFVDSGWDVKRIIKLMVMSRAYRQSSLMRGELPKLDPYNRLLARQSRFRLDAELIRDNALAISGLLVREIGGRSAKPYQPAGLYRHLNFPTREYQPDVGSEQYRRGVYTHWQRQFLHPAMQAFDAPAREECTAERPRSNTPLAALVLLNDPSYVEAARNFAELILTSEEQGTHGKLNWMMRHALGRNATKQELKVLEELLRSENEHYGNHPEEAQNLVSIGLSVPEHEMQASELAAWTTVTRAVLNLHETVTRN